MKKLFYFIFSLCFVLMFSSCEKEQDIIAPQQIEKTRVHFNSTQDFYDTFQALSKMDCDEQIAWINSRGIKEPLYDSIENCNDSVMLDMPRAFQALFNKQLEVEVNDSIISFNEGKMYVNSIGNHNLTTPTLYAEVITEKNATPLTRTLYRTPLGKIGKASICEIHLASGWRHQYVHELKSVVVRFTNNRGGFNIRSSLYLALKFEYKKHKGWREATGELRNIYVNLDICKRNFIKVNRNQEILLDAFEITSELAPSTHDIYIKGTIRHEIIGRLDSRRENRWGQPNVVIEDWYPY